MLLRRVSVLAALILSVSSVAVAAPNAKLSGAIAQNKQSGGDTVAKELNLTQAQLQQIQGIRTKYKDQIAQTQQSLRQSEQELRTLMTGTAPESQVRSKYQQVQGLRQQLGNLRFESQLAMRQVLSPTQRRKVTQLMEQRQ